MPNVKRRANHVAPPQVFRNISVIVPPAYEAIAAPPTFSDAVDRLTGIHSRLEDQVKSLGHLGNCYLGSCPADEATESGLAPQPDGAVNVLASQIGHIEDLISDLEGKIDRFRGRH